MKKVLLSLLFLWQISGFAQNSTFKGVLEYEVTVRINRDNLSAEASNNPNIPDAFNFDQKLYVNGNEAKQEVIINFPARRGNNPQQPRNNTSFRRFLPEVFLNFAEKKVYVVNNIPRDTVNIDKYVVEKSYTSTPDLKFDNKKTKKIAGYQCKKAVLKTQDDEFVIWYTTELGFTYSPLALGSGAMERMWGMGRRGNNSQGTQFPSIVIDNAVIVSIEGSEIGYDLKKVSTENVEADFVRVPNDAQKVSDDELAEIIKSRRSNYRFQMGGGRN